MGSIGLRPAPINISSLNDPIPSIVGSLRQDGLIPSTSWGYLAGAFYYSYPVSGLGSLTFGGYDASRLNVNANLTLAGGSDSFRPYLLGIESITTNGTELLMEPIITALDSLTTQIWLPLSACQAFEAAFNLTWNEENELYLLNEAEHSALVAKNASVTFTLSTGISNSTDRLQITLPYAAFDLKASPPLAGNGTYFYFPLQRAANETQYTLGRVILQEIYMIANYDWGYVTLYEAVYPESSVKPNIITICPPNSTACINSTNNTVKSRKLSAGATAGIVIAATLVLIAICAVMWFKFFKKPVVEKSSSEGKAGSMTECNSTGAYGVGLTEKQELDGTARGSSRRELEGYFESKAPDSVRDSGYTSASPRGAPSSSTGEFSPASGRDKKEASEAGGKALHESGGVEVQELPAETRASTNPSELAGSQAGHELPGSMEWITR